MLKPSLLNALRKATEISISVDSSTIVLIPHKKVNVGGGVWKTEAQTPRSPQTFFVEAVSATLKGITGAGGSIVGAEGGSAHTWSYNITGRYDCEMEIDDEWESGGTVYRIISIQPENGYEKVGVVTAIGKDPKYG